MTSRIGLVGCGNISTTYIGLAGLFHDIRFTACADARPEAAKAQAERFGIEQRTVEELLGSKDIDIVLNLTVPEAHAEVSLAAIAAGKHVYTEKPLATRLSDGIRLMQAAKAGDRRVGAAPDTVLGAGIQEARRQIDAGTIGKPLLGVAAFMSHGMEHWHPNPDFFFKPGGGPVFDIGPYYITALVVLLGPIAAVSASGQIGFAKRTITTEASAYRGQTIKVETLTSAQALLEFHSGAQLTFLTSWDVWSHGMLPIELHGTVGSMRVPDPNWFGGEVGIVQGRGEWTPTSTEDRSFGRLNWPRNQAKFANYRGLGLAEMARAIADGRPHRANGEIALHVLAVMAGILEAATENRRVVIEQGCERPSPLAEDEAMDLLAQ
ncbi:MAG: Gfo/Idh/MocA family oxidoreductase [Methylobacteriaceae bacterium]|nr:Gfo/Idh/MocA family oxidoreductase [Methylobacteriaceae bacterium]